LIEFYDKIGKFYPMIEVRTSGGAVRTLLKYHFCNETDKLRFYKPG
jgi:hypothetical protein